MILEFDMLMLKKMWRTATAFLRDGSLAETVSDNW